MTPRHLSARHSGDRNDAVGSIARYMKNKTQICPCVYMHIKLGLMRNLVRGVDKTGRGLQYVKNKFPNVSDTKIKECKFIGSQIREMMQGKQFDEDLNEAEKMHGCHLRGFARTS